MLAAYPATLQVEPSFDLDPTLHERLLAVLAGTQRFCAGVVLGHVRRTAERAADRSRHARNPYRPCTRRFVMWETAYHARLLHIELLPRAMADDWRY
ncbi:MAG: hypothetical protein HY854_13420 [Burkholderiales bacterium]|nr:hypothetical protein [Burkholderiales bacterium]